MRRRWTALTFDALRTHGLDDAAISDAIQVVSYFNYVTRVADGVGIEDEPERGIGSVTPG